MAVSAGVEGAPSRRAANQLRRRRQILESAAELFEAKGFNGTTTDDVAEAANITKRTLYRYVASKEQLLYELHEDFLRDLVSDVSSAVGTPTARFKVMVHAHIADLASNVRDIKVFFEENKHLGPAQRASLIARRDAYERIVNDILADGAAQGEFEIADIRLATRAILGAMNEGYRWYRSEEREVGLTADRIVGYFLDGIAAPRPRRRSNATDACLGKAELVVIPDSGQPVDRLLRAATSMFARNGYRATNTQQIADAAGVTKGALFYHINNKEEALVGIEQSVAATTQDALKSAANGGQDLAAQLSAKIVALTRLAAENSDAFAVVSEEMKYLPSHAIDGYLAHQDELRSSFIATIEAGVASGDLITDEPRLTSELIIGMINSIYRWYRPRVGLSSTELGLALSALVLRGLANARGTTRSGRS